MKLHFESKEWNNIVAVRVFEALIDLDGSSVLLTVVLACQMLLNERTVCV